MSRATTDAERYSLRRQMGNGMCDACQRARQSAAVEYMAAADMIRLAWKWTMARYGSAAIDHEPPISKNSRAGQRGGRWPCVSWERVTDSVARGVALRMWPADRIRPPKNS